MYCRRIYYAQTFFLGNNRERSRGLVREREREIERENRFEIIGRYVCNLSIVKHLTSYVCLMSVLTMPF